MEVQRLSFGEFPEELWPHFSLFQLVSALVLEGQCFSRRVVFGVIFGGGPFGIWFLSFVRGGEFRWSADFQLIPARGSAPSFSSFQQQQFMAVSSSS